MQQKEKGESSILQWTEGKVVRGHREQVKQASKSKRPGEVKRTEVAEA